MSSSFIAENVKSFGCGMGRYDHYPPALEKSIDFMMHSS